MNPGRSSAISATDLDTYIHHHIERVHATVEAVLLPAHAPPKALHDLHRDLRRLRVLVDWRRRTRAGAPSPTLDELALRLRRLTRLAGRVRDLDVELALWRGYRPNARGPEVESRRALATFGHRLQDDSRTGRELLKATLNAEVNAGFFHRVKTGLQDAASPASTRALASAIIEERRRLANRAARMRRRALRDPDAKRLHEFRVLIRRLRYISDLEDRLEGRHSSTFPARYARVVRRLGELHDRDVLAAHLDAVDPDRRVEPWSRRFRKDHRVLRNDLLKEMKELHPRRHLGHVPVARS